MSIDNLKYCKKRIETLLNNKTPIKEDRDIPGRDYMSSHDFFVAYNNGIYSNGVKVWAVSLCVEIKKSSAFFRQDIETVNRIMKVFRDEIDHIVVGYCDNGWMYLDDHNHTHYRQKEYLHYAESIFMTFLAPENKDIRHIYHLAVDISTFNYWFQGILRRKRLPTFQIGIGLAAGKDVYRRFLEGWEDVCDVWLGNGSIDASNLAHYGNNDRYNIKAKTIVINPCVYNALYESDKRLFTKTTDPYSGYYIYHGNVCWTRKLKWIDDHGFY